MPSYDVFDKKVKELFEAEIKNSVVPIYTVDNPCTRCYCAMGKVQGVAAPWQFTTKQAKLDCWNYILILANRCFSHIWGLKDKNGNPLEEGAEEFAIEHLNDASGCPNCPSRLRPPFPDIAFKARQAGMEFYASLLNLHTVKREIENLKNNIR